jgi:hypothetical protein
MLARLALVTSLLAGTMVSGAAPRRIYVVSWGNPVDASPERRSLIEEVDRQLRDELRRRGASVVEGRTLSSAIVLKPSLEVFPRALTLNLVGVRSADQQLLGTISTRAAGSTRAAQLRAIVARACVEADELQ